MELETLLTMSSNWSSTSSIQLQRPKPIIAALKRYLECHNNDDDDDESHSSNNEKKKTVVVMS